MAFPLLSHWPSLFYERIIVFSNKLGVRFSLVFIVLFLFLHFKQFLTFPDRSFFPSVSDNGHCLLDEYDSSVEGERSDYILRFVGRNFGPFRIENEFSRSLFENNIAKFHKRV